MSEGIHEGDQSIVDTVKVGAKLIAFPTRLMDRILNEPINTILLVAVLSLGGYIVAFLGPTIMSSVQDRYDSFQSKSDATVKHIQDKSDAALSQQRKDFLDAIRTMQDTSIKAQEAQSQSVKEAVKDLRETVRELGRGAWRDPAVPPPAVAGSQQP